MSGINSVKKLQILYFSKKNKKLKNDEKKLLKPPIYACFSG